MILRCWGIVDSAEVEFTAVPDRPGYWEGYAPYSPGLKRIEIWAENDKGARGRLECTVQVQYHTHTTARLILLPYVAKLLKLYEVKTQRSAYEERLIGCRKEVG